MNADFDNAKRIAEQILDENNIISPSIDPFEIATNKGLIVFVSTFEDENIAGFLDIKNKEIYVNADDSLGRKRFTIAHELGHYMLEHKIDKYDVLYRKAISDYSGYSDEEKVREQEANYFAGCLLVPENILSQTLLDAGIDIDKDELLSNKEMSFLSDTFKVSGQVIGFRIKDIRMKKLNDQKT